MRKHFLGLILIGLIAASCGSSGKDEKGNLNDKKVELEKLKKEQSDLTEKIVKLEAEIAEMDTSAAKLANAKLVAIAPLGTQDFVHYIDLQGKIDAENISYVAPRLGPGLVKSVHVVKGQQVKKGQLLLKLDDGLQRQAVAAAKQNVESVRSQLTLARDLYNRQNNLWQQGIGTEVQLLSAKTNMETLENQLQAAQAQVRAAQEQLDATNVVADVAGIADEVNIKPGEMFTGATGDGKPQIRIVNTSQLKAVVEVPEAYAAKVKEGAPVQVIISDLGRTLGNNLKISRAARLINPSTRAFLVEVPVPYDPAIRPNQLAQIRIQDYEAKNTIVIPVNTVQTDEDGKYVFLAVKEGDRVVARKRTIQIGELNGAMIEVKAGLKAGEQLVTEGFENLYEGQVLKVVAQ